MCAPVLSGLDAAVQLPRHPAGRLADHLVYGAPPRRLPPLFLHSIRPALDCAFGTEDAAHFPDAIAALVARLHAGPLGPATASPVMAAA